MLNSPLSKWEEDVRCEKYDLLIAKTILPYEPLKNMASLIMNCIACWDGGTF